MYILFTGFSVPEQNIIKSWSENRPVEFKEGFSVGTSIQIGRLVEIEESYLDSAGFSSLKNMITHIRETKDPDTSYFNKLHEIRFFYNENINAIFAVKANETEIGLGIEVVRIPFQVFFSMVDKENLLAFLGWEEEGETVPAEELELVEVGFLSRYLVCHTITNNSVFLFEGTDYTEFAIVVHFIRKLGEKIGWKWRDRNENSEGN